MAAFDDARAPASVLRVASHFLAGVLHPHLSYLVGIVGAHLAGVSWLARTPPEPTPLPAELLRPLQEYERVLGGSW